MRVVNSVRCDIDDHEIVGCRIGHEIVQASADLGERGLFVHHQADVFVLVFAARLRGTEGDGEADQTGAENT